MILKSLYYPENFFLLILFSIRRTDHRRFVLSLLSLQIDISKIFKRILMTKSIYFRNLFIIMILKSLYYPENFFLLILFSIRRTDHRRFVLSLLSLQIDISKIFKRILMTKSIYFRNLFIIMILKSLYYSDNFSLSILSSIRRIDSRRFLLVYFVCRLIFENNRRKF